RSWRKRRRNCWGWRWSNDWPQHGTDTARLRGGAAFLTLGAQGTGTAMTDAGSIEHSQGAIAFGSTFLRIEGRSCWTAQRPIGLEREICSGKSFGVGWACPLRRSIGHGGWLRGSRDRIRGQLSRCKFGGPQGRSMERMPQFQAQVPD